MDIRAEIQDLVDAKHNVEFGFDFLHEDHVGNRITLGDLAIDQLFGRKFGSDAKAWTKADLSVCRVDILSVSDE